MTNTLTPAAIHPDPEPQPVAWRYRPVDKKSPWSNVTEHRRTAYGRIGMEEQPLYATPSSAGVEVVPDHPPFDITEVGNYYGHLSLKRENGKDYWSIECYDGHHWVPCDPDVATALRALEPK